MSKIWQGRREVERLLTGRGRYVADVTLVRGRDRHAGEGVALAAAEMVEVDYRDRPAVVTSETARTAAHAVWDETADNIAFVWRKGDIGAIGHVARLDSRITCPLRTR